MIAVMMMLASALAHMPSPVRGDFDHDGKIDVAKVVPTRPGHYQLIVVRAVNNQPSIIDDIQESGLRYFYITNGRPGRYKTWCGKGGDDGEPTCRRKSVTLKGDTLTFGAKESSESVALWASGKFEVVLLSD